MKFLIAIGSKEYSEPTLRIGMRVAKAFKASVTICYVGPKVSAFSSNVVRLAQENLERWEMELPGVDVLEWAFNFLAAREYITPNIIETGFQKNMLIQSSGSRSELLLQGTMCKDVRLILRSGDIIDELRDEVAQNKYDVTIIGGSQKRRMAHDLVQFIDSSIFVVNKFDYAMRYGLLVPVNDSKSTPKAVKYAVRVAQAFDIPVDLVTASRKEEFGESYKNASDRAATMMRRSGIEHRQHFKVGEADEVIKKMAGDDHIVVMGSSTKNPVKKFFFGSKQIRVMTDAPFPILIVK
ncbi:MAG: universal stress protein [Candidatus Marinimicrobia bacterium]|nr:universal stress protein [Candidatus Neomarinimicrobiota bacterium]